MIEELYKILDHLAIIEYDLEELKNRLTKEINELYNFKDKLNKNDNNRSKTES